MNILFLTARLPYPPIRGDALIPFYRLKLLAGKHNISLLTFYRKKEELKYIEKLKPYCKDIVALKRGTWASLGSILFRGLFSSQPFQVLYYRSRKFKRQLKAILEQKQFDLLHVYLVRIAGYADKIDMPRVLELIDSMQLNIRRRQARERFPRSWILGMESKRLNAFENRMVSRYPRSVVVSELDRQWIEGGGDRVMAIPLGVDLREFKKVSKLSEEKVMAFTGSMFYFPNKNAVSWFMENCYDLIRAEIPEVRLVIAGKGPGASVKKWGRRPGIEITGYVPSMADILHRARLAIAPMQSGSGMQFKILDAMACGVPVVATPIGQGAIRARDQEDILIADTPRAFAEACIRLLKDYPLARRIGEQGRRLVEERYTWEHNVEKIDRVYRDVLAHHRKRGESGG